MLYRSIFFLILLGLAPSAKSSDLTPNPADPKQKSTTAVLPVQDYQPPIASLETAQDIPFPVHLDPRSPHSTRHWIIVPSEPPVLIPSTE